MKEKVPVSESDFEDIMRDVNSNNYHIKESPVDDGFQEVEIKLACGYRVVFEREYEELAREVSTGQPYKFSSEFKTSEGLVFLGEAETEHALDASDFGI